MLAICSSSAESIPAYLALAIKLAHEAGRVLLKTWNIHPNDRQAFATKTSTADVVTETDAECERIIVKGIGAAYPHHRFIGEESHGSEGVYDVSTAPNVITWIVDPIDGTNNFIRSQPGVCVSIGVCARTSRGHRRGRTLPGAE